MTNETNTSLLTATIGETEHNLTAGQKVQLEDGRIATLTGYAKGWLKGTVGGEDDPAEEISFRANKILSVLAAPVEHSAIDGTPGDEEATEQEGEEGEEGEEGTKGGKMAQTLRKYRGGYQPGLAYSGRKSLNSGDAVAAAMHELSPAKSIALAEDLLKLEPGTLSAKYGHLNPGQQRMNAGNRIRAAFKDGQFSYGEMEHKADLLRAKGEAAFAPKPEQVAVEHVEAA